MHGCACTDAMHSLSRALGACAAGHSAPVTRIQQGYIEKTMNDVRKSRMVRAGLKSNQVGPADETEKDGEPATVSKRSRRWATVELTLILIGALTPTLTRT